MQDSTIIAAHSNLSGIRSEALTVAVRSFLSSRDKEILMNRTRDTAWYGLVERMLPMNDQQTSTALLGVEECTERYVVNSPKT